MTNKQRRLKVATVLRHRKVFKPRENARQHRHQERMELHMSLFHRHGKRRVWGNVKPNPRPKPKIKVPSSSPTLARKERHPLDVNVPKRDTRRMRDLLRAMRTLGS